MNRILLTVGKNLFSSVRGIATYHKSTIHKLVVCTWPLLFYYNSNTAFYHFMCAYLVVLNLLVSLVMCYIILSYVADYYCIRLLNRFGAIKALVVEKLLLIEISS